jgi:hypothetical protein
MKWLRGNTKGNEGRVDFWLMVFIATIGSLIALLWLVYWFWIPKF